jgi:hypothetical protein
VRIGLWVSDELSYDRSIPDHDHIAALMQNEEISGAVQTRWGEAKQLAPELAPLGGAGGVSAKK